MGNKCGHCEEIIKGEYIEAMGKTWCPDHFVCSSCSEPFPDDKFYKHEDHPYCEKCYRQLTSEECAICGEQILDGEMMDSGDKKYHMKCFICEEDKKPIGDGERYHEYNGKLYCNEHLKQKLAITCDICVEAIKAEYIIVDGKKMHKECYEAGGGSTGSKGGSTGSKGGNTDNGVASSGTITLSGGGTSGGSGKPGSSGQTTTATTSSISPAIQGDEKVSDDEKGPMVFYAYESLTDVHNCPPGVDKQHREQHLEDSEFEKLFGCSKEGFNNLPKWKKMAKKKKLLLW